MVLGRLLSSEDTLRVNLKGNILVNLKTLKFVIDNFPKETKSVEITPICYNTTLGSVKFCLWDTAAQEKVDGLSEEDLIGAQCAIIMFDLTKKSTYENALKWYKHVFNVCE